MKLHELNALPEAKAKKRVGRGPGSGMGKMHPEHALFRFQPATQASLHMGEGLRLLHPDPC